MTAEVGTEVGALPLPERARAIFEIVSAEGARGEALGRLTDAAIAALRGQELFGLFVPRMFGGLEAGILDAIAVIETVSEADGSAGWVLMASQTCVGAASTSIPDEGARALFRDGVTIVCGSASPPPGRAVVDGDGYRLSGKWRYASGVYHADYVHSGAVVYEDGNPRETRILLTPFAAIKPLGNWDVIGLRATGSIDYALDDVYVPKELSYVMDTVAPMRGGDIHLLGIVGLGPLTHGAFAVGVARRILNELVALTREVDGKAGALAASLTSDSFLEAYGVAEAKLRSGRAFFHEMYGEAAETIRRGDPVPARMMSLMRLSVVQVTQVAAEVCNFAYHTSSGVGLRNGTLQRCYRDMMAGYQHRSVSPFMLRECAREILDLMPGKSWTFLGLR